MEIDGRHPRLPRLPLGLLLVSCLVTGAVVTAGLLCASTAREAAVAGVTAGARPRPAVTAAAVLHDWDVRRARAWAAADVAGLRGLYVAGSRAGRRDVAMLRAWTGRGVRVRDLTTQLLAVHVRSRTDQRLVLDVTDRLVGAVAVGGAVGGAVRTRLPADAPSAREIVLVRDRGRWRVESVRPRPA